MLKIVFFQICILLAAAEVSMIPFLCDPKIPDEVIDTAEITIYNDEGLKRPVVVYLQSEQCYKCDLLPYKSLLKNCTIRVDTRWPMRIEIRVINESGETLTASPNCSERELSMHYVQGGKYSIYIQTDDDPDVIRCVQAVEREASDTNIPIYVAIGIGCCLALAWIFVKYLYRKGYVHRVICFWSTESMMSDLGTPTNISQTDDPSAAKPDKAPVRERLKSLDTFRGISIVIMIFVNYGGGKYWFFKHSKWNGLTVADLVFPWFVFIMGTALAFSFQSQLRRNTPKWKIFMRILKRSATLFLLGLLINSFGVGSGVDFTSFRIPGVLQRFAGTYLISASLFLYLGPANVSNQYSRLSCLRDITAYWLEWLFYLAFIALHSALTFTMPVPGCPTGYLGPGGLEQEGHYFNCTGGAAGYIDRKFFGDSHIYQSPTSKEIYKSTAPYDPEGLLGTLNSCVLCFLGLQAGKILFVYNDWVQRCRRFFAWAVFLICLGTLLCKGSLNEGWIPINKNLWSLSFVFILAGMAFFLLMLCYILIDVYKIWSGAPFFYAGMNSIALYCGHEFFSGRAPVFFQVPQTHASLLALNIWGTTFWVFVSIYFYYKDIFISV
ncbi:heparan-alpha-glucosaminide N-acetyltransferase-like isoform X1 [Physella acuta]|uniref:heparan-alpha-glucosaminide N-acetyltransferase-like isoform X1 n=1 Tax=Physella acuta TaxID=109671 RepID=UPI0027DD81FC|nr:heparan-alpha-glucosaminide N-acetyltransferase-like isoform X1 [Physella acuta]